MKITKLGHCCLVLEHERTKILTDPGSYTSEAVKAAQGIDVVLITHEHQDHYHVPSIHLILENNPGATIVSNGAVAKLLKAEGVACTVVGDGQAATIKEILIEGFGKNHAPIYGTMGLVENTGYFIANKFYFPGDAFHDPGKPVDVLALPTAGPWMKVSEALDFARATKPRMAFPVHDGMIVPGATGFVTRILQNFLTPDGVTFIPLGAGEAMEF